MTKAVGGVLIVATLLQKAGYLTIHYTKVESDMRKLLDVNGDGKVDAADQAMISEKFVKLMTDNGVGSAAGFSAGFAAGFKS